MKKPRNRRPIKAHNGQTTFRKKDITRPVIVKGRHDRRKENKFRS